MAESFTLIVDYKNTPTPFEAELRILGYTHKIAVQVAGTEILFEPDEERNYRAVLNNPDQPPPAYLKEMIQAIASALEASLRG